MNKKHRIIDSKLILAYQSGNNQALSLLVKRWHKRFCNKAFWLVKDADVAKDIAQDSWKTIIAKINNLKETNSFESWAMRIVYTKSLDWIKKRNAERGKLNDYQYEQTVVEEELDNHDVKKLLLKAITKLPMQQQIVIKLFYVEDYSLKEISEILKISVGTVKSRLFHAREKLKQSLKTSIN